jgi:NADH:ubiquinone reductase (H+-translocating)
VWGKFAVDSPLEGEGFNYEADLDETRVPLDEVLRPIGVKRVEAEVTDIDFARRRIVCAGSGPALPYDRLVFALGSWLVRPPIPALAEHAFDVDTYDGGCRLNAHIVARPASRRLGNGPHSSSAAA